MIMKIKPILFSTPMVQAILNGSKTQTRRTIKKNLSSNCEHCDTERTKNYNYSIHCLSFNEEYSCINCGKFLGFRAKVKKGDIFWVRETFGIDFLSSMGTQYCYRANKLDSRPADGWKPSIFMPKDACRIFLEVTNERVERLRDISEKDAKSEGIAACPFAPGYKHYTEPSKFLPYKDKDSAGTSFFSLWMSINGAASLDANPFVFVYDFKITERPTNFLNNE